MTDNPDDILGPDGRIRKERIPGLVAEGVELYHKRQYEAAVEMAGHLLPGGKGSAPAWEDLTEEQRANIREANRENQRRMNDLGNAIATGSPLPDPFK